VNGVLQRAHQLDKFPNRRFGPGCPIRMKRLNQLILNKQESFFMTKEKVKHRKDERKKPQLSPKERKAKKLEKKQQKSGI
jgi:hypothetical protein